MTTATWLERAHRSLVDLVPEHLERLAWPASRLVAHQRELQRELLGHAAAESPFHRDRLAGIDPHTFELDDLGQLPVMTKAEMMERFDEVCTDRRLTRDAVDAHVRRLGEDVELLEGGYVVFASGGSSGRRGLFVRHHTELPDYLATVLRSGMADVAAVFGWPPPFRLAVTVAAAPPPSTQPAPRHRSAAGSATSRSCRRPFRSTRSSPGSRPASRCCSPATRH
jgi:hypothetical protein